MSSSLGPPIPGLPSGCTKNKNGKRALSRLDRGAEQALQVATAFGRNKRVVSSEQLPWMGTPYAWQPVPVI
uniref:Uncharacterized protein n=1 Tax=Bradyrhizobium diazoefficiens TaxID=1355477 RepID=A0A810AVN7_9BRAD|nr:hypothetical protein XF6B_67310 [Bradyrhizobium diazoefficiens]